jgi:hypothetical protein
MGKAEAFLKVMKVKLYRRDREKQRDKDGHSGLRTMPWSKKIKGEKELTKRSSGRKERQTDMLGCFKSEFSGVNKGRCSIEEQSIEYCGWACCVWWRGAWRSEISEVTKNAPWRWQCNAETCRSYHTLLINVMHNCCICWVFTRICMGFFLKFLTLYRALVQYCTTSNKIKIYLFLNNIHYSV